MLRNPIVADLSMENEFDFMNEGQSSPPLVTIILTTLNSARYVERSVQSCLAQTYTNLELIIVDGGSTDGTLAVLAAYRDPRIRIIHQQGNQGKLPGALNLGMANANGCYITWTQDDSWYEPDAIHVMVEQLENCHDVGLVYTDFWCVDEEGKPFKYQAVNPPEPEFFLVEDVVGQCFLFRREVYEKVGPQDVQYFPVHEVPWRLKITYHFNLLALHRPLLYYTLHDESLTGRIGGWELQRIALHALQAEHYVDQRFLRRQLAQIDIDQAFDAFVVHGDFGAFRRLAFRGIRSDMRHLRNWGCLKLFLISLLPIREACQRRMQTAWEEQQQSNLFRALSLSISRNIQ